MDCIKKTILLIFLLSVNLVIVPSVFAQNFLAYSKRKELPELATKQSIDNLRFISYNGKFTYYQKRTGELNLSTNYKVVPVIKKKAGTNYLIYSTSHKKRILIQADTTFHSFYGVRKPKTFYVSLYGQVDVKEMGKGISPKLHLEDRWLSFYDPHRKVLFFKNLEFSTFQFQIKIRHSKNPYFVPNVIMNKDGEIYYTDINKLGIHVIKKFNRKSNKNILLYSSPTHHFKLELCLNKSSLILGEFNFFNDDSLNMISLIDRSHIDFSKRKIIYESPYNDFGNIICNFNNKEIFFIKNFKKSKKDRPKMEVARISIESKEIKMLSDVNYATQIINMDGRLLLPYRGKFYLLLGKNNLASIDMLEDEKKDRKGKK